MAKDGRKGTQDPKMVEERIAKAAATRERKKEELKVLMVTWGNHSIAQLRETSAAMLLVADEKEKLASEEHSKKLRELQEAFAKEHGLSISAVKKLGNKTVAAKTDD